MSVSIIIPVYNCALYLTAALHSVTQQSEKDLDIVVVDDGSTDASLSIARHESQLDPRIRVYSQANMGTPSVARNRGIREARGEFITFLDGDDLYDPEKIARELEVFRLCPELDVVFADIISFEADIPDPHSMRTLGRLNFVDKASAYLEHHSETLYICKPSFYNFMATQITSMNTHTVMVRRRFLEQESPIFREDWPVGEDIDLWFRLARRGSVAFLDEALAYYRQRPSSLMSDNERALIGFIRAHSANLTRGKDVLSDEEKNIIKSRLAKQYFYLGYNYFSKGKMREARASYASARNYDRSIYSRYAWLKTFLPYFIVSALAPRK